SPDSLEAREPSEHDAPDQRVDRDLADPQPYGVVADELREGGQCQRHEGDGQHVGGAGSRLGRHGSGRGHLGLLTDWNGGRWDCSDSSSERTVASWARVTTVVAIARAPSSTAVSPSGLTASSAKPLV